MKSAVILQVRWGFKGVKRLETCSGLTQMLRKATLRAALRGKRTEDTSENQSRAVRRHYKSLSEMHSWTARKCLKICPSARFKKSFRVKMSVNVSLVYQHVNLRLFNFFFFP